MGWDDMIQGLILVFGAIAVGDGFHSSGRRLQHRSEEPFSRK